MRPPTQREHHPFFRGLSPTLCIAHRGGALLAPENTLAAFEMAVGKYRADVLELDVHQTQDGVVAVSHDPTIDRCSDGTGNIAELTFSEIRKRDAGYRFSADGGRTFPFRGSGVRIPALEEVFRALPDSLFNIDLKVQSPALVDAFADLVRREEMASRICCGSEWDDLASQLADALPESCRFYPRQALTELVLSIRGGDLPDGDPRFHVLDMPLEYQGVRLVDAQLLTVTRQLGLWVNVWTVDEPAEMRRLIDEGVGGVMTDRPDLLREVLHI